MSNVKTLAQLRLEIDHIDQKIVALLNQRAGLVEDVGHWKQKSQTPIYDPKREEQILENVKKHNTGPLSEEFLRNLFVFLVSNFRQWESNQTKVEIPLVKPSLVEEKKILFLGLGLMGSSCVLRLRPQFPSLLLVGVDPQDPGPEVVKSLSAYLPSLNLESRMQVAGVEMTMTSMEVVILALPMEAMMNFIRRQASKLRPNTLIIDLGSTKKAICDLVTQTLPAGIHYVGLHPMVGKAGGGSAEASSELYFQQKFLLVIPRTVDAWVRPWCKDFVKALGGTFYQFNEANSELSSELSSELTAEVHDQVLAVTSHLPQFLSTALTLAAQDFFAKTQLPLFFGPAFRDLTRLATSDYSMWRDIAKTNSENILQTLQLFRSKLELLEQKMSSGDFQDEFSRAKKFKEEISMPVTTTLQPKGSASC